MTKRSRWLPSMATAGLGLFCGMALPIDATPADGGTAQQQTLVEQKLRLVELLVNSPATKGGEHAGNSAATAVQERRRQLLDQARLALAGGRLDEAGRMLDEALVGTAKGASRQAVEGSGLTDIAQRAKLKNLTEQLASYRGTLRSLARERQTAADAQALLTLIEAVMREAEGFAGAGRIEDANRRLTDAYRVVVADLARLQAGQTVTHSLTFDTPADEYAYEQRRLHSNEMLSKISIDEARPEGDRLALVKGLVAESRRVKDEAAELARQGDYRAAVAAMEKASNHLIRAMQALGVPVF